jgi:hypothetical protein
MIDAESNVILRRQLKRLGGLRPFPLPRNAHRHAESTCLVVRRLRLVPRVYGPTEHSTTCPLKEYRPMT